MLFQKRLTFLAATEAPKPGAVEAGTKTVEQIKKEAKEAAILEIKKNPGEALVEANKLAESAKLQVDKVDGAGDESKAKAKEQISDKEKEFVDFTAKLSKRLELKTGLDALDPTKPGFDFLNASEKMNAYKTQKEALAAVFPATDSVLSQFDTVDRKIGEAAQVYYSDISKQLNDNLLNPDQNLTKDGAAKLVDLVGKAQQAQFNKFPGTVAADTKALNTDFDLKINAALNILNKNQGALDEDTQRSLKRLGFARTNLANAEAGDSKEHQAGAKEYMEMVVAEQEARRVWASLSAKDNWRSADINTPVDAGWDKNGDVYKNYDAAYKAFKLGLEKSNNEHLGDSLTAKNAFKDAAEKFRLVFAAQEKEIAKKAEALPKDDLETAKVLLDLAKGEYEKQLAAHPGTTSKAIIDSLLPKLPVENVDPAVALLNSKERAGIYKSSAEALSAFDRAQKGIEGYRSVFGQNIYWDNTAKLAWDDADYRFSVGNFGEAAKKYEEAAKIYEYKIANKNDFKVSVTLNEKGEVIVGTKEKSEELKGKANMLELMQSPEVKKLTASHLTRALDGENKGEYGRSINQYQEIIRMCTAAAEAKSKLPLELRTNLTVQAQLSMSPAIGSLLDAGNYYYQTGNFEAAKKQYDLAAEIYNKTAPQPIAFNGGGPGGGGESGGGGASDSF